MLNEKDIELMLSYKYEKNSMNSRPISRMMMI